MPALLGPWRLSSPTLEFHILGESVLKNNHTTRKALFSLMRPREIRTQRIEVNHTEPEPRNPNSWPLYSEHSNQVHYFTLLRGFHKVVWRTHLWVYGIWVSKKQILQNVEYNPWDISFPKEKHLLTLFPDSPQISHPDTLYSKLLLKLFYSLNKATFFL